MPGVEAMGSPLDLSWSIQNGLFFLLVPSAECFLDQSLNLFGVMAATSSTVRGRPCGVMSHLVCIWVTSDRLSGENIRNLPAPIEGSRAETSPIPRFDDLLDLLNLLRLGESADGHGVGLASRAVVEVPGALSGEDAADPVLPRLLHQQTEPFLRGWHARVWRQVGCRFVEEEGELDLFRRGVLHHPLVDRTHELLDEDLLELIGL